MERVGSVESVIGEEVLSKDGFNTYEGSLKRLRCCIHRRYKIIFIESFVTACIKNIVQILLKMTHEVFKLV